MLKSLMKMKKKDFKKLNIEKLSISETVTNIYGVVIIPTKKLHDSGYACMEFILCDKDYKPIFRTFGGSDVIKIDGIGGYGKWNPKEGVPKAKTPIGWSIDCLPCGYLMLWCNEPMLCSGISTFEIVADLK